MTPLHPLLAALAALLILAPAAPAAWFAAEPVDGPDDAIVALGGIDVARDGTGGLVYVKRVDGVPHVFLSRLSGGVWGAPERVDTGIAAGASEPVIAAGDGHRLAIAWLADGKLWGSVAAGGTPQPLPGPALLADHGGPVSAPDVDLGVNGTAYVAYAAPGAGGSDVRAVRLHGTTWEAVPAPLDIAPDQPAGTGAGRPRVGVSAEGYAVVTWGEGHPDGRPRVYARRVTGLALSVAPQEVSLPEFGGVAGGPADSPDIDIEEDGSFAWVVFRQDFGDASRAIGRRLVGSLFEAPEAVDGGARAAAPRFAMSGRGVGIAAVADAATHAVQASLLERDAFLPSLRVDGTGSSEPSVPVVAASERDEQMVAWRSASATGSEVRARQRPRDAAYEPEAVVSQPAFGVVDGRLEATEDRAGDFFVAFVQAGADGRRLVVATFDEPPGVPVGLNTTNFQRRSKPTLKWRAGLDLLGAQTFRVYVDGALVGETTAPELRVPVRLAEGVHTWQVISTDRRGQERAMRPRTLRIDASRPRVRVKLSGRRQRGNVLRVRVRASDRGTGVRSVAVSFGDGASAAGRRLRHRYMRPGRYRLVARAVDRAGNVGTRRVIVRIRG